MDEPDINYDDMIEDYMEDLEEQQKQQPPFLTTTAAHPTGQYEYDDAFLEEMQATATQAESARMMMMTTTTATTTMDAKNNHNNKNDNAVVTMTSNKNNNDNAPAVHDIVVSNPEGNVDSSPLLVDASSFTNEPATVLPSTHVRRELAASRRSTTSNLFSFER